MFAIPRRTSFALARSRPRINPSALRTTLTLPRSPLPGPQRHFTAPSRVQAQYTRFSNGYTHRGRRPDQEKVTRIVVFITAAGVVYIVAHLEQVPETGRWRFMDTSAEIEAELDKTSYEMLLSEFEGKILPPHHLVTRHVHRVVSGLLEASNLGTLRSTSSRKPHGEDDDHWAGNTLATANPRDRNGSPERGVKEWNLLVVDDPKVVNALASFSNIVVFTGILPICKDEEGLAAVVGHEIGHAVARHASERRSSFKLLLLFATLLNAVGIDFGLARLLNYLIFQLPNSRTQELEADTLGMRIAAKACYDPQSAVELHKRLASASESGGLSSQIELLRTHPIPERRIKHLEELVPEAYEIRAASPRCAGVRESIEQFLAGINRWN